MKFSMSALEELQQFVSLCHACGMIPYVMEYDSITKKFVKFTFSFKYFTTWWFISVSVLLCSVLCVLMYSVMTILLGLLTNNNVPIKVPIIFGVNSVGFFTLFLVYRLMVLRFRRLRSAVRAVQEVERLFGNSKSYTEHKKTIKKRFLIGFSFVVIAVSYFLILVSEFNL